MPLTVSMGDDRNPTNREAPEEESSPQRAKGAKAKIKNLKSSRSGAARLRSYST